MRIDLIPISISLISLAVFEIIFFIPKTVYYLSPFLLFLIFISIMIITKDKLAGKEKKNFLIFPMMLMISFLGFSIVLANKLLIQVLYLFYAYFNYYYIRSIFYYFHKPSLYRSFTIENISSYGNLIMFFLFSSLIYGLQSLIDTPTWILIIAIGAYSALVVYQLFWAYKIESSSKTLFIIICCLAIVEFAWTIAYLPVKYMIAGMILSLCYYVTLGLVRHYLIDKLDSKTVKLYLGFAAACLAIILLTSQWI
jgi:hypothetical protein